MLLWSSFYSQSSLSLKRWSVTTLHCMKRSNQSGKQEFFSASVWYLEPEDRVLEFTEDLQRRSREAPITDKAWKQWRRGAAETMRAARQQCCDKVRDDNEGERSVTKLSESVTIWSLVCLCLKVLHWVLGDGNMKGWRKEDSAAGGEKKKKMKTASESLFLNCRKSSKFSFRENLSTHFFFTIIPSLALQVSGEVSERTAASWASEAALLGCDRALRTTPGLLLPFNSSRH